MKIEYNKKELKHSIDLEIGIDHFTSASSDNVSPNTGTNASTSSVDAKDTRIYPAINWQVENEKKEYLDLLEQKKTKESELAGLELQLQETKHYFLMAIMASAI